MATPISFQFDAATHIYSFAGVKIPSVTQILEGAGLVDYAGIPKETLDYAAKRGTAVHMASVFFDQDDLDPDSVDPQVAKYLAGWKKFREDHSFKIIESERAHLGTLDGMLYGMTVDRVVELGNGNAAILDIKCSTKVHRWTGVQLAGYAIGLCSGDLPAAFRKLAVQLRPDCTYKLYEYNDPKYAEIFGCALKIAYWKDGFKPR